MNALTLSLTISDFKSAVILIYYFFATPGAGPGPSRLSCYGKEYQEAQRIRRFHLFRRTVFLWSQIPFSDGIKQCLLLFLLRNQLGMYDGIINGRWIVRLMFCCSVLLLLYLFLCIFAVQRLFRCNSVNSFFTYFADCASSPYQLCMLRMTCRARNWNCHRNQLWRQRKDSPIESTTESSVLNLGWINK